MYGKNDGGVEQEVDDCSTGICKPTTCKNSCIAQAYHQQRAKLPAVVQMTRLYICACARHGVREISALTLISNYVEHYGIHQRRIQQKNVPFRRLGWLAPARQLTLSFKVMIWQTIWKMNHHLYINYAENTHTHWDSRHQLRQLTLLPR